MVKALSTVPSNKTHPVSATHVPSIKQEPIRSTLPIISIPPVNTATTTGYDPLKAMAQPGN